MTYTLPAPPLPPMTVADHAREFERAIRDACGKYTPGQPGIVDAPKAVAASDYAEFWHHVQAAMHGTGWTLAPSGMRDGDASRFVVPE